MTSLFSDLRSGLRVLWKSPGPAAVVVLVLAVGIGVTTAMFSIVYGIVLRGIPFEDGERIAVVETSNHQKGRSRQAVTAHEYLDFRDAQSTFEDLDAFYGESVFLAGDGSRPERLQGMRMTHGLFDQLRTAPVMGRGFTAADDEPGAPWVALVSYAVWRDRYGSEADLVGRTIRIDGKPTEIVGVMPEGFQFPVDEEIWRPLKPDRSAQTRIEANRWLQVIGRLRDGATYDQAAVDLATIAQRLGNEYPASDAGLGAVVRPFLVRYVGEENIGLSWTCLGAVGFVLLIACFNVANLLLARSTRRSKELALRTALGASRGRMVSQVLGESLVLAGAAAVLGLGLAEFLVRVFNRSIEGQNWPYWFDIRIDLPVLGFVLAATLAAAVMAGLAPALRNSRLDVGAVLKDEARGSTRSRLTGGLVIAEVALSATLLIGAGLMVRTLVNLADVEYGFDPRGIFSGRVWLLDAVYDEDELMPFWDEFERGLQALPGVREAGLIDRLPAAEWAPADYYAADYETYARDEDQPYARRVRLTPSAFKALGVEAREGRLFDDRDRAGGAPVIVVNRSFAERAWPDGSALGKQVRLGGESRTEAPWRTVVGVVDDVAASGVRDQVVQTVYVPLAQCFPPSLPPGGRYPVRGLAIVARTDGAPLAVTNAVRDLASSLDPDLPVYHIDSLEQKIDDEHFFFRMVAGLFGTMAVAALLLAVTGLYSVLAFSVSLRTAEMGIRMALGAAGRDVRRLVIGQGVRQVAVGLAIGLAMAFAVARLLGNFLFGVNAADPVTFGGIAAMLLLVGAVAALVPAVRASRVDPIVALHYE